MSPPDIAPDSLEVRIVSELRHIRARDWDALLCPGSSPFVRHAWLSTLENSGCIEPKEGWLARHITLWQDKTLLAAAPGYVKGNSEGEFVFDQPWSNAAARAGLSYYPKFITAVPFTPATGSRLLVRPDLPRAPLADRLVQELEAHARKLGLSSVHLLFHRHEEQAVLQQRQLELRLGLQLHWRNPGYRCYDDFLATFDSSRRNKLKRERREVLSSGISVRTWRGREITDAVLETMFRCYCRSVERYYPWTRQYLTRAFFEQIVENMPDAIEIVTASEHGELLAGAFNVTDGQRLYGRYWGALQDRPFLHFHVCYYHSIEECIARGIQVFEPGAGGGHKAPRGFEPTVTWSSHLLFDERLDRAVRAAVRAEREAIRATGAYEEGR